MAKAKEEHNSKLKFFYSSNFFGSPLQFELSKFHCHVTTIVMSGDVFRLKGRDSQKKCIQPRLEQLQDFTHQFQSWIHKDGGANQHNALAVLSLDGGGGLTTVRLSNCKLIKKGEDQ